MIPDAPKFLCYTNGDNTREAAIVWSKQDILSWLSVQWIGKPPDPEDEDWAELYEDLEPKPYLWNDGEARLVWQLEQGHVMVEFLSDHWDESWVW